MEIDDKEFKRLKYEISIIESNLYALRDTSKEIRDKLIDMKEFEIWYAKRLKTIKNDIRFIWFWNFSMIVALWLIFFRTI